MNGALEFLTANLVQCWACPVFDNLFVAVGSAAENSYGQIARFALFLLTAFIAFYTVYIVMTKLSKGAEDPFYMKSMKPVLINSIIIVSLIGMGTFVPKTVARLTLEPVAAMTHAIASSVIPLPDRGISAAYEPKPMPDSSFYSPALKNRVLDIMQMTTTAFQGFILFGFAMISNSLNLTALLSVLSGDFGPALDTVFMFFLGVFVAWSFIKLFLKFLFYFIDVIVSLTLFAFLFPIMLMAFVMKNSEAPGWVKSIGGMSGNIFQTAVRSVITLASAMIVYVVILAMLSGFIDLSNPSFESPAVMHSAAGIAVLVLIIGFLAAKIDDIAKELLAALGFEDDDKAVVGLEAYKNFAALATNIKGKIQTLNKIRKGGNP
ncbi:MAG: hypothetical protein LBH81_02350 [Rickettsiales bacterium]|jgi:hypothetical protein|nr:hypothetical protein [Rickettsiales bacterium]